MEGSLTKLVIGSEGTQNIDSSSLSNIVLQKKRQSFQLNRTSSTPEPLPQKLIQSLSPTMLTMESEDLSKLKTFTPPTKPERRIPKEGDSTLLANSRTSFLLRRKSTTLEPIKPLNKSGSKDSLNSSMTSKDSLNSSMTSCDESVEGNAGRKKLNKSRFNPNQNQEKPKAVPSFRQLIFSPYSIDKDVYMNHLMTIYNGLVYSTNFLKAPKQSIDSKQVFLGRQPDFPPKKTLLLDLDETLIKHCKGLHEAHRIAVGKKDGVEVQIPFKVRPYVNEFLKKMKAYYEIVVFTASASYYAEAVVKELDTDKTISAVLDRNSCFMTKNGFSVKDLSIIDRKLSDMVIVDNLVHSFGLHLDNGIPILEWNGDSQDKELMYLAGYLADLSKADDVREYNAKRLRLREMLNQPLAAILEQ